MLDLRQHQMLDAMGVQLWSRRDQVVEEEIDPVVESIEHEIHDWDSLQTAVAGCHRCELASARTQTVFGTGDQRARAAEVRSLLLGTRGGAVQRAGGFFSR